MGIVWGDRILVPPFSNNVSWCGESYSCRRILPGFPPYALVKEYKMYLKYNELDPIA